MRFEIPRGRMLRIDTAELVVGSEPHPYQIAHAAEIEAQWQLDKAANPRFFDGTVMMFSEIVWNEGRLDARCHPIRYATFLHWQRRRPATSAEHVFAHAIPVTSDGALIAIRMSSGTANAGRVYFAAGSFDTDDVVGGRLDIDGNMMREVREETGLDLRWLPRDPAYHGWSSDRGTVIVRRYHLPIDAATAVALIRDHVASDKDPEIEEPVTIRRDDRPSRMAPHMDPLIDWHFGLSG